MINYEEGGENCVLHGDEASEAFLSEIIGAKPYVGARHPSMESIYEYGSRAGVWRLHRLFEERQMPCTVFCVGMALERNPEPVLALRKAGHEIASHGYRWIDYQFVAESIEREHIEKAVDAHQRILGERPMGFIKVAQVHNLTHDEGSFIYDADSTQTTCRTGIRFIANLARRPYTLDTNDMRFASPQGFNSGLNFLTI